jgi:hypothetical protein
MSQNDLMSTSAAQADAFYCEALEHQLVWGIKDENGFPAPETPAGRAMPFWSLRSRAERIVGSVPAYARAKMARYRSAAREGSSSEGRRAT